jgi:hypothetical protein
VDSVIYVGTWCLSATHYCLCGSDRVADIDTLQIHQIVESQEGTIASLPFVVPYPVSRPDCDSAIGAAPMQLQSMAQLKRVLPTPLHFIRVSVELSERDD